MVMADKQYKSPTHKVIAFLKKGRDGWHDKYKKFTRVLIVTWSELASQAQRDMA